MDNTKKLIICLREMKLKERKRAKFRVLRVKILPSFQIFHLRERCCQLFTVIFVDRLIVCLSLKMTSKRNLEYLCFCCKI